ncbi:MAG: helix-turn-helix transcriptional regulator [Clostridia bacterium]|nr:helix-turn-helix transcriptional regulator [Clostridia bacterium]
MVLYTQKNSSGVTLITYKEREIGAHYSDRLQSYDECKIVRIMRGRGIWIINGGRFPFEKDDIFLFSGCDVRRLEKTVSEIKIEQVNFIPLTVHPHGHCADIFFLRTKDFSNKITDRDGAVELAACFDRLREYVLNKKLLYRDDCIQNLVCKMVITAAQCCPSAFDKSRGDANMCAAAIKYISGNLSERLSLYDIAGKFGFSEGHFSRLFQKSVGISYNEYVTRLRVNAVIRSLGENGKNVLDTALSCGFRSSSGFYKAFYRITGATPKNFRK